MKSEKVKFYLFLEARNTKEDLGSISPAGGGLRGRTRMIDKNLIRKMGYSSFFNRFMN